MANKSQKADDSKDDAAQESPEATQIQAVQPGEGGLYGKSQGVTAEGDPASPEPGEWQGDT